MIRILKVLFLSTTILFTSAVTTLPYSDENLVAKEYYTEPIEVLDLAHSLEVNVRELHKLKEYPIYSPIAPKDIKRISSYYGYRKHPIFKITLFHTGIDYSANKGTPIRSTANGIVDTIKYNRSYGYHVVINHTNGYSTLYAHLKDIYVKSGTIVHFGDTIASVGSSGYSTGFHLHYEIRKDNNTINPLDIYPMDINDDNYMSYFNTVNKTIIYSDNV